MGNALATVGGVVGTLGLVGLLTFGARHGRTSPVATLPDLDDGTIPLVASVCLLALGVVIVDRFWQPDETAE